MIRKKLIKLYTLFALLGSVFLIIFVIIGVKNVRAQTCSGASIIGMCADGSSCYSDLRVDMFTCDLCSGSCCANLQMTACTACTSGAGGSCRTIDNVCSTADSCDVIATDPHTGEATDCGWNGSSCGAINCSSCGRPSCCGPGGATSTPTPTSGPTSTPTPTPTPIPPPSCSGVSINASSPMQPNSSQTINITNPESNGTIDEVTYTSSDGTYLYFAGGVASETVTRAAGGSSFQTTLFSGPPSGGLVSVSATARMVDEGLTCTPDPATVDIEVQNADGWSQFRAADAVAAGVLGASFGDIIIPIPTTCSLPTCDPNLITYDSALDEEPGVAIAGRNIDTNPGGSVSSPQNWQTEDAGYNGTIYQYSHFRRRLPSGFPINSLGVDVAPSALDSGGTQAGDGYFYYHYVDSGLGDLNLGTAAAGDDIDLGSRKVVVFVEGAGVNINSNINLTDGEGLFVLISEGDINVYPGDGADSATAVTSLEGIYFAQGQFATGTLGPDSDEQLTVRGSVAGGDIALQRSLPNNSENPAELFQFGPDQFFLFPELLGEQPTDWREAAP